MKSLPGNRLKLRSIPANRLKPGALARRALAQRRRSPGRKSTSSTLGQVPERRPRRQRRLRQSATDAQTALNAVNAINAQTVNGHEAGCLPGTVPFAGACWQSSASETAVSAPAAANSCAVQGGTLPRRCSSLLSLSSRGALDRGDEWSSDIPSITGPDCIAV